MKSQNVLGVKTIGVLPKSKLVASEQANDNRRRERQEEFPSRRAIVAARPR